MSSTPSSIRATIATTRLSWRCVALTAAATILIAAQQTLLITCVKAQGAITPLVPSQCECSLSVNGKAFPSDSTPGCSECSSFNLNCAFGGKRRRLTFSDSFEDRQLGESGGMSVHSAHPKDVVSMHSTHPEEAAADAKGGGRALSDIVSNNKGVGQTLLRTDDVTGVGRGRVALLSHHSLQTVRAASRTLTDAVEVAEEPEGVDEDAGDYEDGACVCCCPGHLISAPPAAEPPVTTPEYENPDDVPESLDPDDDVTAVGVEPPATALAPSDSSDTVTDTASDSPDTPADTAVDTNSDADTDSAAPEDPTQASPDTESDTNTAAQDSDSTSENTSSDNSNLDNDGDSGESDPGAVIGGVVAAILLIIGGFVGGVLLCWCRGRKRRRGASNAAAAAGYDTKEAASTPAGHVAHDQNYRNPGDPPITPLAGPGPSRSPTTASTPATDFNTRASGHTQHTGPSLVASAGSTAFSYPLGGSRSEPDFKTASAHDSGHENSRAQGYDVPQSANLPPGTTPSEGVLNAATATNTNSSSTSTQRQDQSATQQHSPADPAPSHGFQNVLFANANDSVMHGMQSDNLKGSETAPSSDKNIQDTKQAPEQQGGPANIAPQEYAGKTQDTFDLTHTAVALLAPPGPDAPSEERVDFLHQQLDSFGLEKPAINDLVLLGGGDNERRQGGQAIVQMAMSKGSREEYAIKFFVSRTAFHEEAAMYSRDGGDQANDLVQFLPQVMGVYSNTDKALVDTHGHALPPCIVMERGQSLDIWARRAKPDRPQAYMMMHQLAARLRDLHALGYVHRDLKPGNVMWLPRENRWTLIDFGCVARTGERARMGFSLAYAAPEVIAAYRRGERSMVAEEAVDVWSLGVMAFELLTGGSAVSMLEGKDKVMDRIEGRNGLQLPWDASALTPTNRRKLGIFKQSVTMLLSRDPALRPSMAQFCESCDQVLAGSTTVDDT